MKQFEITFFQLWKETFKSEGAFQMDLKQVENLQLDPRSNEFGTLVTSVYCQFEVFKNEECIEQKVKDYIQNTLREIQPYL